MVFMTTICLPVAPQLAEILPTQADSRSSFRIAAVTGSGRPQISITSPLTVVMAWLIMRISTERTASWNPAKMCRTLVLWLRTRQNFRIRAYLAAVMAWDFKIALLPGVPVGNPGIIFALTLRYSMG